MVVPNWLLDLFAALMIAVSAYFAGRLVVARTSHRKVHVEVNVAELVMGVAMAGMFVPALNLLPNGLWEGIFAGFALWFIVQNVRFVSQHGFAGGDVIVGYHRVHYPLHVIMSFSMLYMYLAASTPIAGGSDQMAMAAPTGTTADFVGLPLFFAVFLCGFAVWQLDGINRLVPTAAVADALDPDVITTPSSGPNAAPLATSASAPSTSIDPLDRWQMERWLAPRLETGGLIVMSIAMAFLLILML